jgi:hypothetical protein
MKKISTILLFYFIVFNSLGQKIKLIRLNECDYEDLITIKMYLESEKNLHCTISNVKMEFGDNSIDCDNLNKKIFGSSDFKFNRKETINIFVTKSRLICLKDTVCGASYGNSIYISTRRKKRIKPTISHELAHSYGAEHCNEICIMNIDYNRGRRKGETGPSRISMIWDSDNDKPKFCRKCSEFWNDI